MVYDMCFIRVPQIILVRYENDIWFGFSHDFSFIRPKNVDAATFPLSFLPLYIREDNFDNEVCPWPEVTKSVIFVGVHYYFPGKLKKGPQIKHTISSCVVQKRRNSLILPASNSKTEEENPPSLKPTIHPIISTLKNA